jgi:hypothetical protein
VKAIQITSTLAAVLLLGASHASAQSVTLSRGDISGSLGVQTVETGNDGFLSSPHFDGGFYGSAAAGWYWTEHLKTEIDFGARTKGKVWVTTPALASGPQTYYPGQKTFSRQTLALGQQYQFFHNAWFHPHLGAGVNLVWERSTLRQAAVTVYDPATRTSRTLSAERVDPPHTAFMVNPFVESGFKAYMTPRTFFRGDLRVAFRNGVNDVITRFGFGFDF